MNAARRLINQEQSAPHTHHCQFCHREVPALESVLGLASALACRDCAAQMRNEVRKIAAAALVRLLQEKSQTARAN